MIDPQPKLNPLAGEEQIPNPSKTPERDGASPSPVRLEIHDSDEENTLLGPPPPRKELAWAIGIVLLSIFSFSIAHPEEYHFEGLYNVCIALTIWSWRPRWVILTTIATLLLRLISHEVDTLHLIHISSPDTSSSRSPTSRSAALFNLTLGFVVQAMTGTLIWRQVLVQRRLELNQLRASKADWERRHREAQLLTAEQAARAEAQAAEEKAQRRAQDLAKALDEARVAIEQAEEATKRERRVRLREEETRERLRHTTEDLNRVKNLSMALSLALLPKVPTQIAQGQVALATRYFPAEQSLKIGGDFYDVLTLDDTGMRYGLVIGDVAGHGVEAAAQMALVTTTLRAYAASGDAGPGVVMSRLGRAIDGQLDSFVSLVYGVYDASQKSLTYANAGHEPPILIRVGCVPQALNPTGPILGLGIGDTGADYQEVTISLEKGDLLVMLTDGLTEVKAITGQMLDWEGMVALVARRSAQTSDVEAIADTLLSDARAFAAEGKLTDDVALLVARVMK